MTSWDSPLRLRSVLSEDDGLEPATTGSTVRNSNATSTQRTSKLRKPEDSEAPTGVPCPSKVISGQDVPADLVRVNNSWHRLPKAIKAGILALVNVASDCHD